MKLLLVQPPIEDFYDTDVRLQPVGLCYLKAAVQKYCPGWSVTIRDYHRGAARSGPPRKTIPLPRELKHLRAFFPARDRSPFSTFHEYYRFGQSREEIVEDVRYQAPDLVGISSLFSPYYREALDTAKAIRQALGPDVPIVMGGSHVSACPDLMLSQPFVDCVIRGEGERPLVELLNALTGGSGFESIPGLGWKKGGRLRMNPMGEPCSIESLPPPDLSDLPLDHYRYDGRPMRFMITSRGCPYRCNFCSVHTTFGQRYRRNDLDRILDEMVASYAAGVRVFDFEDDNLTFFRPGMTRLCDRIIEAFPKKDVRLLAMNGVSYMSLDVPLLQRMKEAGFTSLNLSLVTANHATRKSAGRPHSLERYREVVEQAFSLGYRVTSYQILGLPGEFEESMVRTLQMNAALPVLLGASPFYLTPDSPLAASFPQRSEEDLFLARLTAMCPTAAHEDRASVYSLFIVTRILNFLKGIDLAPGEEIFLEEALNRLETRDVRSATGVRLLRRLMNEGVLFASTSGGDVPLPLFRFSAFQRVMELPDGIASLSGGRIRLCRKE